MRRVLLFFFILIFYATSGQAQIWTRMQSWGLDFEGIDWISDQKGVIVGENLITYTEDGGNTWKEVLQPFPYRILAVEFQDSMNGLAVGEGGHLLVTRDGGKSWTESTLPTTASINDIAILSNGTVLLVGENGLILRSTGIDQIWITIPSGQISNLNQVEFFDSSTGYAVGSQGKILKTQDGGQTWQVLTSGTNENLKGIAISKTHKLYAVGQNGIILNSTDQGVTWTKLSAPIATHLTDIKISPLDERILVISGEENSILRSTNSGTTFSKINLPNINQRKIQRLEFKPGSGILTAVGQEGYALQSTNSGGAWTLRMLGLRNTFSSVDFKNNTIGYVSGQNGFVQVTTNGFTSAVVRSIPEPLESVALDFWNTSFGYFTSFQGKMYRTTNSGTSWLNVSASTPETILGMYLFDPNVPYISGTNGYIARSFDAGITWDANINSNTTAHLKDITFFDFQTGFAIGNNGQISWSFGGSQWENLPKITNEDLNALAKLDSTTAIIVGNKGVVLKSTDMAKTWQLIPFPENVDLLSVDFWDKALGFISGKNGLTYQTKDSGETWVKIESGTTRDLLDINYGDPSAVYAVGKDGTVLKYTCATPVNLSDITGESTACVGVSTYSVASLPEPGSQIEWRIDGGEIISGQGSNSIQVNWTQAGRNGVYVSRVNFCGNGQTSFLEIQVNELPPSDLIIEGQGAVCANENYTYSLPALPGTTYTWTAPNGEIVSGQGQNTVQIKWTTPGSTQLKVILENECGESEEISSPIQVNSSPDQPSPIVGQALVGLGEQTYEIASIPGLDYQWTIGTGGKILAGQGTSRITVNWETEGIFQVEVKAQNECNFGPGRVLEVNVNVITAIEPDPSIQLLRIFPNPSRGNLQVELGKGANWNTLELINAHGQKIQVRAIQPNESTIFLDNLPKGLLILRLSGTSKNISRRIMIY